MKQYEAVRLIIDNLGGIATLGQINQNLGSVKDCTWSTKTPFASVRRIVQTDKEIYKIKPGLYGLVDCKKKNDARGYAIEQKGKIEPSDLNHSYYQGILLEMGQLKGYDTFCPHQDKNKAFLGSTLGEKRSLEKIPKFSYEHFIKRSATIDVIWFNERNMPDTFIEIEHSTDFQNSFSKYDDLRDFNTRMIIVADKTREENFKKKIRILSFENIAKRIKFLSYENLIKQYEYTIEKPEVIL